MSRSDTPLIAVCRPNDPTISLYSVQLSLSRKSLLSVVPSSQTPHRAIPDSSHRRPGPGLVAWLSSSRTCLASRHVASSTMTGHLPGCSSPRY
jgi:hypothetical protein